MILTDLSMPVMDGYKLISRVCSWSSKNDHPKPVIAAITGHTESEFITQAFEKGADQVYSKPISLENVRQVLLQGGI